MTTWRLPPEPEGPVWQWNPVAKKWAYYEKTQHGSWRQRSDPMVDYTSMSWARLLERGEVTSEEPIAESKEELADKVVHAAVVWCVSEHFAPMLRAAVGRYNRKLHQLSDERTTG